MQSISGLLVCVAQYMARLERSDSVHLITDS